MLLLELTMWTAKNIRHIIANSDLVVTVYKESDKSNMFCRFVYSHYKAPVSCTAPKVYIQDLTDEELVEWADWDDLRLSYEFTIPQKYEFITDPGFVIPENDDAFREYIASKWWALKLALDSQSVERLRSYSHSDLDLYVSMKL